MSYEEVRGIITTRLDEGDRGDRGWFAVTRIQVRIAWLRAIVQYVEARGSGSSVTLNNQDYSKLAAIIESSTENPGSKLRRHHLLLMEKPLQLIQRVNARSWQEIKLTDQGRKLALTDDPSAVMETVLSNIRFAVPPWYSQKRSQIYNDFDVSLYIATQRVLDQCGGYIDRDEFDFFVSRIRNINELSWAVNAIKKYRKLDSQEQNNLKDEVRNRLPDAKEYRNWRDMALHTFSLFSLGATMIRDGTALYSVENWSTSTSGSGEEESQLKMPNPSESETLLEPPAAPANNDGSDAESFVAKVFRSRGWVVSFYTNLRGFGFDLWARRGSHAVVIEVKSSVGPLSSIRLTKKEFEAARQYGENFVLALVENLASDKPKLYLIEDPAEKLIIREQSETVHVIPRTEWARFATIN